MNSPVTGARVLVLLAHPDLQASRVHRQLRQALQQLPQDAPGMPRIELRDLYALYPDFDLDPAAEQAALADADLIVWQHPIHWYSMPALMKLWLDRVLSAGWAYGHGSRALAGKDLWLVASTGGHAEAYQPEGYNQHPFSTFLAAYEQTARLCGLRFLPPLLLHGAHALSPTELAGHAERYVARLQSYPAWPELAALPGCTPCEVPDGDRRPLQSVQAPT
ncbi:MAG: hypothetical protein RJA44_756 [Pseudomonadota bacterium]